MMATASALVAVSFGANTLPLRPLTMPDFFTAATASFAHAGIWLSSAKPVDAAVVKSPLLL